MLPKNKTERFQRITAGLLHASRLSLHDVPIKLTLAPPLQRSPDCAGRKLYENCTVTSADFSFLYSSTSRGQLGSDKLLSRLQALHKTAVYNYNVQLTKYCFAFIHGTSLTSLFAEDNQLRKTYLSDSHRGSALDYTGKNLFPSPQLTVPFQNPEPLLRGRLKSHAP